MNNKLLAVLTALVCSGGVPAAELAPGQGFIEVPGGPVWYKVVGDGPGLPLLVLHGGPGGTSCGYARLESLGSERPVIRYDQLGSGRSGRPDDPSLWTVDRFVEELHVLRSELGLQRMHLLGHSWGGALAAAYVIQKGSQGIASLVLSSPLLNTAKWVEDANLLRSELPAEVQRTLKDNETAGTTDSDAYREASRLFYERHVWGGERGKSPPECDGAPMNRFIYEYMWGPTEFRATGTLVDFDVTNRLHEIDVPVLFVAGQYDEARPETLAEFQQRIPGAELMIILDAAHGTLSRKPVEYMNMIETFFDSIEAKKKEQ